MSDCRPLARNNKSLKDQNRIVQLVRLLQRFGRLSLPLLSLLLRVLESIGDTLHISWKQGASKFCGELGSSRGKIGFDALDEEKQS